MDVEYQQNVMFHLEYTTGHSYIGNQSLQQCQWTTSSTILGHVQDTYTINTITSADDRKARKCRSQTPFVDGWLVPFLLDSSDRSL